MSLNIPGWLQSLNRSGRIATASDAYEVVPMLYRAVNLRCDAISTVPYTLTRRGETVDWPWRQSVSELIRATERSMLLTGGAYWYKVTRGRTMTGFVVLNPTTMVVGFEPTAATLEDPYSGALFTQSQMGKVYGPWTINEIVYFREPSYRDDIRPGLAPAAVALQSAQLGHYLERFTSAFFEGGAQPVMVMNLPEAMDDAEFARFRGDFSQRVNGVANAFRSLFVRTQEIKVQKITPDINTMMLPELQERVITSIAMTMGVPRTMLEASAANYAIVQPTGLKANVTQATITVTGPSHVLTQDATGRVVIPTLTATVTGLKGSDTVTGAASLTTTATATSPKGTYAVTVKVGTLKSSTNYKFVFVDGSITIQ